MKPNNRTYDRETVIEAAKMIFWKKGYHLTSLKDLEAAMDMKPGSIYAAFSSKEALFHVTLARYYDHDFAKTKAYLTERSSPLEGLTSYLREASKLERHMPCSLCMLVKTVASESSPDSVNAKVAQDYLAQIQVVFEGYFAKAQSAGEIDAGLDPCKLALRYQSNLTAIKFELHRGTPREDILALTEDMVQRFEMLRLTEAPCLKAG